jgi:hypothetical protein
VKGDHSLAAGAEILLFGPEKHKEGPGVLAQLARVALVGECAELGGRVMLRASWARPSGGSLGEGTEDSLSRVRYPSDLHVDAQFEILTPHGTLYATNPVHIAGRLKDLDPRGTDLTLEGPDTALVTENDTVKARLTGAKLVMRESIVGEHAAVNV